MVSFDHQAYEVRDSYLFLTCKKIENWSFESWSDLEKIAESNGKSLLPTDFFPYSETVQLAKNLL